MQWDMVQLFTQGGFALVTIGVLVWVVRYFMSVVDRVSGEISNLTQAVNALMNHVSTLVERVDRLMEENR